MVTIIVSFIFPLILFRSNIEHLVNIGLHNLQSKTNCAVTGQDRSSMNAPTFETQSYSTTTTTGPIPSSLATTRITTKSHSSLNPSIKSLNPIPLLTYLLPSTTLTKASSSIQNPRSSTSTQVSRSKDEMHRLATEYQHQMIRIDKANEDRGSKMMMDNIFFSNKQF